MLPALTEKECFNSFKICFMTASMLYDEKEKQLHIADEVFQSKYGFSFIKPFRKAYEKVVEKKIIQFNKRDVLVKRLPIKGETTSEGLNKGLAPNGFLNKRELFEYLRTNYGTPSSLVQKALEAFCEEIESRTYKSEINLHQEVHQIDVPCYKVEDVLLVIDFLCRNAWQKRTQKQKPSVMCHIPELNKDYKFNLNSYQKIRMNDL